MCQCMFFTREGFGRLTLPQRIRFKCATIAGYTTFNLSGGASMKRQYRLVLICLLALAYIPSVPAWTALSSSRATALQETQDTTEGWARDNYDLALDLVFKDGCTASKGVRWIACVRIVPGHPSEIEYTLSVEKTYSGTILARITRPRTQSVYTQLCKQRKEHPAASVGDLAKLIEVESQASDQQKFPALARLANEFEKVRLSPVLPDEVMMDATKYVLRSKSSSGDQMELVLRGPGPSAPHQPQPVIQWAESARQVLSSTLK